MFIILFNFNLNCFEFYFFCRSNKILTRNKRKKITVSWKCFKKNLENCKNWSHCSSYFTQNIKEIISLSFLVLHLRGKSKLRLKYWLLSAQIEWLFIFCVVANIKIKSTWRIKVIVIEIILWAPFIFLQIILPINSFWFVLKTRKYLIHFLDT